MQQKLTVLAIVGAGLLIGGAMILTSSRSSVTERTPSEAGEPASVATAVILNGVQYIDIIAEGGYSPRLTQAQAGIPTVIRMKTENTYDCSSTLVIPAVNYSGRLKATGVEEIPIPVDRAQGTLNGLCGMGMYTFSVEFK